MQASQSHVAGHAGPSAGRPETCPCLLQRHLAPSRCIKDFGTFHPCILHSLSQTEQIFYDLFLTLSFVFSLWTLEDHLDTPGSAGGAPAGVPCPSPASPLWLGPWTGPCVPQLTPQGPPRRSFCSPLSWSPGAVAGPLPNLRPWSGQGQLAGHYAKAIQGGSMGGKVGAD